MVSWVTCLVRDRTLKYPRHDSKLLYPQLKLQVNTFADNREGAISSAEVYDTAVRFLDILKLC